MKDISKIKQKVRELQNINGGKIFVFPITPEDPFSKYAFTIDTGKEVIVFPDEMGVEEAAAGGSGFFSSDITKNLTLGQKV